MDHRSLQPTQADASLLEKMFTQARSQNGWLDRPVANALLEQIHDLARLAPTSMNCSPLRITYLVTTEAKEKLRPALAAGNVDKMMTCPVVAIFATDFAFAERLPFLFPHTDGKGFFERNPHLVADTAFRNATLQAGYYMLAARALGLDCGPISGFDAKAVDAIFFSDAQLRSNFLCGLGHGDPSKLFARHPRLSFEDACQIL
ncbi:malonic semialdehyde reductase [Ensifer sp. HO-A22]|uniref:Putative NADH dehydrogenase/NAD(P)H nitroreductase HT585_16700 n=1 Tax=Ensifer oleiphilus TaxID=2742698 RepID=A0A7Y6Q7Y9_9HYPH|nr:malonic semialdehyde reductase [Ensifer oleiphilus]NVD40510.1 malonic semialdehyde reductase [Ensifer oleiphilus]